MNDNYEIRLASIEDAAGMLAIYGPFVLNTAINFEYEVPSLADFGKRITAATPKYPWLACLRNDQIVGYAYASDFRYRAAYQWSPESTIYVAPEVQGHGVGKALYQSLFSILKLQGFYNVFAGVALPNDKSERLHKSMGFKEIGVFENVGYKLGKWQTTRWFQLCLSTHMPNPTPPLSILATAATPAFAGVLAEASARINSFDNEFLKK